MQIKNLNKNRKPPHNKEKKKQCQIFQHTRRSLITQQSMQNKSLSNYTAIIKTILILQRSIRIQSFIYINI